MEQKDYHFKKITLDKNRQLILNYNTRNQYQGSVRKKDYQVKTNSVAHPDMVELFNSARKMVANVFGLLDIDRERFADDMKKAKAEAWNTLQSDIDRMIEGAIHNIEVRSFHIKEGKTTEIIISAVWECEKGQKVSLNTPKLSLEDDCYGFEAELSKLIEDVEREAYEYIEKGKESQLKLDIGASQEELSDVA